MQKFNVDKDWFHNRLKEQDRTLRGLARYLDVQPSTASRMLSGERRMKREEAVAIARFLVAPVQEVIRHAGIAKDLDGEPTGILLAARIDENGEVHRLKEPKQLPQSVIDKAQSAVINYPGDGEIIAAQIRALTGPLAFLDDAVVLFAYTDNVDQTASGSLAICRSLEGQQIIAKIVNTRKTGEARIVDTAGDSRDVTLQTATPVLAIIP